MKRLSLFLPAALFFSALAACGPAPAAPTATATATDRPMPIATYTPSPTNMPIPPLVLSNFDSQMEDVGEHGNMACIIYQGNQSDLEGLTIKADISQGDKVLDANVPIESIEGQNCFEMVDAKYNVREPVLLDVKVSGGNKAIENNGQKVVLGNFIYYPFINSLFIEVKLGMGPL